jgi:anti-anti-sigma factor
MEIEVSQHTGRVPVTVFHLRGDLNVNSYEQLEARAREAHAAGVRDLVLDLSGVQMMSSAGIRALNTIFHLLRTSDPGESDEAMHAGLRDGTFKSPHLKLLSPTQNVQDILTMSGIDMLFEIYGRLPEAIASF